MISSLNNGFWEFNMIKHQFNPKFKQFNIQLLNNFHSKEREPGSYLQVDRMHPKLHY